MPVKVRSEQGQSHPRESCDRGSLGTSWQPSATFATEMCGKLWQGKGIAYIIEKQIWFTRILIQFRLISYPLPLFCDLFFFSSQLPRPLAVWTTWGAIYGALAGRAIQGWKGIPLLLGCGRGWEAPQWDSSIAGLFLERLSMLCGYTFESFKHNLQLVLFFGEQVCYVCPRSMRSCQLRSLVYSEETMMLASLLKHEHSWHGNLMKFASTNAPSFRHIFAGRC